jgi:hypothetical protein
MPVSQSVDAGLYSPNPDASSARSSAPAISFTTAQRGDRMRRIEKTGPELPPPTAADAEQRGGAPPSPPQAPTIAAPVRSILRVKGGGGDADGGGGGPTHASSVVDGGGGSEVAAPPQRMSLQVQFAGLAESMPAADAHRIMAEMAHTRFMAARLRASMEATGRECGEPSSTAAAAAAAASGRRNVRFAEGVVTASGGGGGAARARPSKKKVRFADDDGLGRTARRLHLRRGGGGRGEGTDRARRIERVEYFDQHRAERDLSFVRPGGRGRQEMRRRLLEGGPGDMRREEAGEEEEEEEALERSGGEEVGADEAEDGWMRRRAAEQDASARYTSLDGAMVEESVSMQPPPPALAASIDLTGPLPTTPEAVDAEIARLKAVLADTAEEAPSESGAEQRPAPKADTDGKDDPEA